MKNCSTSRKSATSACSRGKETGLFSRALTSPCGKIRIPINESQDDKSQIEEYLNEYKGEGIQHIALGTDDIYRTVDALRERGVEFQDTPATYYEGIDARVAGHQESLDELQRRSVLIDGSAASGILLQIFTKNAIGPIFFEIIQRKGNEGFGEGNFQALFESIELDQKRRGVMFRPPIGPIEAPIRALNFAEAPISNPTLVNPTCRGHLCEDY